MKEHNIGESYFERIEKRRSQCETLHMDPHDID